MEHLRGNNYYIGNDLVDKYWELITEEENVINSAYFAGVKDLTDAISCDHSSPSSDYYKRTFAK